MAVKGQLSFIRKAPIYHISLNHVWEECPNCKAYNKATIWEKGHYPDYEGYWRRLDACPECGQLFDWNEDAVEAATKYSKDYPKQKTGQIGKGDKQWLE